MSSKKCSQKNTVTHNWDELLKTILFFKKAHLQQIVWMATWSMDNPWSRCSSKIRRSVDMLCITKGCHGTPKPPPSSSTTNRLVFFVVNQVFWLLWTRAGYKQPSSWGKSDLYISNSGKSWCAWLCLQQPSTMQEGFWRGKKSMTCFCLRTP